MNTKLLRRKILDLAIRGKLVPQAPNDEPASVLIERIRAEKEQLVANGKIKKTKHTDTSDKPHYQNTPFNIPASWQWVRLGEVVNVINGKNQKAVVDENGQYPIYGSGGVIGYANAYLCKEHSTIIGRKGTIDNPILVETKFWNVDTAFGMEPDKSIDHLFFYYFCKGYNFKELDKSTTLPSLTKVSIERILIPLPPLAEQKRIVAEIERWFALIDDLEANKQDLQTALKRTKAKVLDLAIHGKLVPQDPADEPAIDLLHRINPHFTPSDTSHYQKPPFNIPTSWQWVRLGEVGTWQAGGTPNRSYKEYYGGDIPWLKTGDLNDGYIKNIPESITQLGLEHSSAKLNPKDSVLIALYGATIGKVGILTFPATTNQACCACIDYPAVDKMYLFYFLRSHRDTFVSQGGGGAQPNISKEIIVNTLMPLPPIAEQRRIVARIEKIFAQLDSIAKNIQ